VIRVFNRKYLKSKRKHLRNNSTEAEILLWTYLKGKQLNGRKFRRQQSIGNYIVDFYCPTEKLAIELDGDFHFDEVVKKYDEKRTEFINKFSIKLIRFENQEVLYNLETVLKSIEKEFKNHLK
jgi:very-short-patch-repair endonuclease